MPMLSFSREVGHHNHKTSRFAGLLLEPFRWPDAVGLAPWVATVAMVALCCTAFLLPCTFDFFWGLVVGVLSCGDL